MSKIYSWGTVPAIIFLEFLFPRLIFGQTPSDALMMHSRQACVLIEYNQGQFDSYWEGNIKRQNQTIATVKRQTIAPMIAVGFSKRFNLFVGLPYMSTRSSEPNGGHLAGAAGFQDIGLALKYRAVHYQSKYGEISVLGTLGFSTPITKYNADYQPYSLGLGAPEIVYRGIAEYKSQTGVYLRLAGSYNWRGFTKSEREYYFNNGSYYTSWMDVPNLYSLEPSLGIWLFKNSWQIEFNYVHSSCWKGDDIRAYNAPQPTNNTASDRLGIFTHFYPTSSKGLGIVAYHHRVINGRNVPAQITSGAGITYLFNYLKQN